MQLIDAWYAVELSSNLKNQPISIELFESKICLWRDQKGTPHAMVDRCPHKGAALSKGKVVDDNLQCPYHGWTYDASGVCISIPAAMEGQAIPKKACLPSFACEEHHGLIFVWWGSTSPEPFPDMEVVPHDDDPAWRRLEGEVTWEAHWLRVVEGYMDLTHAPFVHTGSFGSMSGARIVPTETHIAPNSLQETIVAPRDRNYRADQRWGLRNLFSLGQKKESSESSNDASELSESSGVQHINLWLANVTLVRVVFGDFQISLLTAHVPVSGEQTRNLWQHFRSFLKTAFADNNARKRVGKFMAEDQRVIESMQPQIPSVDSKTDLLHETDVMTLELRKLLQEKRKNGLLQEYDAVLPKNT